MSALRFGAFEPLTQAMGPGNRCCLWVAGCSLNCHGCATPEFIPKESGSTRSVADIIEMIDAACVTGALEGISFSGGEPFEQAEALAEIARHARSLELSTLSWSGYTRAHLEGPRAPKGAAALLAELDVLIDGRYVRSKMNGDPLRGSSNQRIHLLTSRYAADDFSNVILEARVGAENGKLVVTGVDDTDPLRIFLKMFGVSEG
jgi:anaerobic ribonucleoside-triphosphate reductase activating protein